MRPRKPFPIEDSMAPSSRSLRSRGLDLLALVIRLPLIVLEKTVPGLKPTTIKSEEVVAKGAVYTPSSAATSGYSGPAGKPSVDTHMEAAHSAGAKADAEGYYPVTRIGALKDGVVMVVRPAGKEVALAMVGGEYRAVDNTCPHAGGSLADGDLDDQGNLTCSLHGWSFSTATGKSENSPGASIAVYPVKVVEGQVMIKA